jgi:hypothetical protein
MCHTHTYIHTYIHACVISEVLPVLAIIILSASTKPRSNCSRSTRTCQYIHTYIVIHACTMINTINNTPDRRRHRGCLVASGLFRRLLGAGAACIIAPRACHCMSAISYEYIPMVHVHTCGGRRRRVVESTPVSSRPTVRHSIATVRRAAGCVCVWQPPRNVNRCTCVMFTTRNAVA